MGLCRRAQVKHFTVGATSSEVTSSWVLKPKPLLAFIPAPQRTQILRVLGGLDGEEAEWDMVAHSVILQIGTFSDPASGPEI